MKKVLGLICSPRKMGNCEIAVKEISRNISTPHELKLLRLADFNILPCKGCYLCLFQLGHCIQKDDFHRVLDEILDADALIISVPAYFMGPNATLKLLLDRGIAFYPHSEKLWGKPAIGVGIAGVREKEGYTLLGIENFLSVILAENKSSRIFYGAMPGEIFLDEQNKKAAVELASALFAPLPDKNEPCCPVCGGTTMRFLDRSQVRCMLCSNAGTVSIRGDRLAFDIQPSDREMFTDRQSAAKHRDWLISMKQRYVQQRSMLKQISKPYENQGTWVKPQLPD
ncbi:MAG: flavodoxin family protein [Desulfobacterales bacterium]|nr:flavodoxin family protein [Desulfobacterales bacterium]